MRTRSRSVSSFLGCLLLAALACPTVAAAADLPTIPIHSILEQRLRDDSLAVVVPDRLEIDCRSSPAVPWDFSFPAFETTWPVGRPIELEVTNPGPYVGQDSFSIAALALDFHTPDGYAERSLFGLGFIQNQRAPHPPTYGVGPSGRTVFRGNLLPAAGNGPQHLKIDPAKYAPKGWDGRLWIGLFLHNIGTNKTLAVRITNALPPSGKLAATEPDEQAKRALAAQHEMTYLRSALARLEKIHSPDLPLDRVPADLRPYAQDLLSHTPGQAEATQIRAALKDAAHSPDATAFLTLSAGADAALKQAPANDALVARINALDKQWQSTGRFGEAIRCMLRLASGAEKVPLTDLTTGQLLPADPPPIRLSAARHEYESFQLILTPLPGCAEHLDVSVSDLKGPAGVISSDHVSINPVGYIRPTPDSLVPDPLLLGPIPALKAGENQPVWITVYAPPDTAPGEYTGTVTIRSATRNPQSAISIPLTLRVRPFSIPKRISLRSSFWIFRDQINRFYHLDEVSLDDYFHWIHLALQHRLNPIDVYEGHCRQLLPIVLDPATGRPATGLAGVPNPHPDFTAWDKYLDRMIAGGANTLHLGQTHHQATLFAGKDKPAAQQLAELTKSLAMLRDHYARRGLLKYHYLQLRDETSSPESLAAYREVQKALPDLKLLLTAPSPAARPFLTIPCPLSPAFDPKWRDAVHAKGGEYWWYVCVEPRDPNYPNLFLAQTAAQHRALFWETWANHVDGLLYWGLNFWSWYQYEYPAGIHGPTTRVPPKGSFNFVPVPQAPGDGFSMYPGPTPSQPLSSIRLEAMRDGEEDYEYLVLLDKLIAQAEHAHPTSPALARAKAARDAARKLVPTLTDYPRTGEPYLKTRDRIADAIEALMDLK